MEQRKSDTAIMMLQISITILGGISLFSLACGLIPNFCTNQKWFEADQLTYILLSIPPAILGLVLIYLKRKVKPKDSSSIFLEEKE